MLGAKMKPMKPRFLRFTGPLLHIKMLERVASEIHLQPRGDTVMSLVTFLSKEKNSGNFGAAAVAHSCRLLPCMAPQHGMQSCCSNHSEAYERQNLSKWCALAATASGPLWMFVFTVVSSRSWFSELQERRNGSRFWAMPPRRGLPISFDDASGIKANAQNDTVDRRWGST